MSKAKLILSLIFSGIFIFSHVHMAEAKSVKKSSVKKAAVKRTNSKTAKKSQNSSKKHATKSAPKTIYLIEKSRIIN
jgi:hypothetical protein